MKFCTKVNVELHMGIVSSHTMHVQLHVLRIPLNAMQIHYTQSMQIIPFQVCYKCYLTFKYASNILCIQNCKKWFKNAKL
jgi:hypothetical protein